MMTAIESRFATPDNQTWALAAENGGLLVKHCRSCGRNHYYPRPFCVFCFSEDVQDKAVSGTGIIYSFTVNRTTSDLRVNAFVRLEEGPAILTEIVDAQIDEIAIGKPVELLFRESRMGFPAPVFRLTR